MCLSDLFIGFDFGIRFFHQNLSRPIILLAAFAFFNASEIRYECI